MITELPYIPLLTTFTHEDRAAKGLRKRVPGAEPEPTIHYSAVEVVRDNRLVLLSGPSGSGKTTFAKHLCADIERDGKVGPTAVVRNEDGLMRDEEWGDAALQVRYCSAQDNFGMMEIGGELWNSWSSFLAGEGEYRPVLFVIDAVECAGRDNLATIVQVVKETSHLRLLLLSCSEAARHNPLAVDVPRFEIMQLMEVQRRRVVSALTGTDCENVTIGIGEAAKRPVLFTLALQTESRGDDAEMLVDAWLGCAGEAAAWLPKTAFDNYAGATTKVVEQKRVQGQNSLSPICESKLIQQLLAARYLIEQPLDTTITCFNSSPTAWEPIVRSILHRLTTSKNTLQLEKIMSAILAAEDTTHVGALLAASFMRENSLCRDIVKSQLLAVLEGDAFCARRAEAGRMLSHLGDPRDLQALVNIPGGTVTMGSASNTNSLPIHQITIPAFKMGVFPVVNQDYAEFVSASNRPWNIPTMCWDQRFNIPATDVTWHDAVCYCEWLTSEWRKEGKIRFDEVVRLPTEPEWEYAARGMQDTVDDGGGRIFPWGVEWPDMTMQAKDDVERQKQERSQGTKNVSIGREEANYEVTMLNGPVSVGVFPRNVSPFGVYDMAGNVWEWCSTAWGTDMTEPSFRYPWSATDGREAMNLEKGMRRVLRGGCFSSERHKTAATYRGSVEQESHWRGNGFRIVVAPARQ
ncbi:DUF323-domain-containing protein [Periconia macrospinosa]|uniref:DUF323-domain-containing protein n=1 Tax=Periconia macrospinosa TaxID=97972 RepID=A0A2V1DUQ8_9PLEO|nr:DUF323-domain-containing protein [Periconia macrospinosa]